MTVVNESLITHFELGERIDTNGVSLEVFSFGQENGGKPLVLCHGWPWLAFSWRYQIKVLVEAGYHVIVPNQRGYGRSSAPAGVTEYDITHLTDDLVGLLDHYGYEDALFIGHDWGALVIWSLAIMHPERVAGIVSLSVPFRERGEMDPVESWKQRRGSDFYVVHFNEQPGVADRIFADNCERFLRNLYRTNQWRYPSVELGEGMDLLNIATAPSMPGDLMMSEEELNVFVEAYNRSGFTGGINWYRNLARNWRILGHYEYRIRQPALMIYSEHDIVPRSPKLSELVENLEVLEFDCGHCIQQERPSQTNEAIIDWLQRHYPTHRLV